MELSDGTVLDCTTNKICETHEWNHSCILNIEYAESGDKQKNIVAFLTATRKIREMNELTADYDLTGTNKSSVSEESISCKCASRTCCKLWM